MDSKIGADVKDKLDNAHMDADEGVQEKKKTGRTAVMKSMGVLLGKNLKERVKDKEQLIMLQTKQEL